jgi:3-dehydroquinate dehydratase-2
MIRIGVINGPNLGRLGQREPAIYGCESLESLYRQLQSEFSAVRFEFFQSNHEGAAIDQLERWADSHIAGVVMNPGAWAHQSYALRDAIASLKIPTVEVHISNIYAREPFRAHSVLAPVVVGQISGLGLAGYRLAVRFLWERATADAAGRLSPQEPSDDTSLA